MSRQPSALTLERQRRAADPSISAFVMANAGSGKTTVLVNRVLRLLLDGARPARILCLTYTKAAAANMQLRVFKALSHWAGCTDAELAAELQKLCGEAPKPATMARARTLFATALETPGGLAIGTIHSFCERVLHTAPFEADVPADFTVIQGAELRKRWGPPSAPHSLPPPPSPMPRLDRRWRASPPTQRKRASPS